MNSLRWPGIGLNVNRLLRSTTTPGLITVQATASGLTSDTSSITSQYNEACFSRKVVKLMRIGAGISHTSSMVVCLIALCLTVTQTIAASESTGDANDERSVVAATYSLDARQVSRKLLSGHLKMGGTNPQGQEINANNLYFTIAGQPILPIMGEMHFSRYPRQFWEESILKMKANGIDIIATYVFWIYHEEVEGKFDWSGNNDLRHFVELCAKHNIYVFLRIGPWAHGECRNGGFPDWLEEKCAARSNDPKYLAYAQRLYEQIFKQVDGFQYKQGGPIIGLQLENEFMHAGGGTGGQEHMMNLKRIAKETGFDVPLYTATGWGGTPIPQDEFIPVQSGYPVAPWTEHTQRLPASQHFIFSRIFDDPTVGSDLASKKKDDPHVYESSYAAKNYDETRYPLATAELAGGIMDTYHRRPLITSPDVVNLAMTKLGSGANLIGHYMFHGGSHRVGLCGTLEEQGALKYPKISYDFQAPVREFGQINDSYHDFRILHLFVHDFAGKLTPTLTVLPAKPPAGPDDTTTLRYCARVKDDAGFLFVNNYQIRAKMQDFNNIKIELALNKENLTFPMEPFTVKSGVSFIWPFNLELDGALLKYATAQPICRIEDYNNICYFFFATPGIEPEYLFDRSTIKDIKVLNGKAIDEAGQAHITNLIPGTKCIISLQSSAGKKIKVVTLTSSQARTLWKGQVWGRTRAFLTNSNLLFEPAQLDVYGTDAENLSFSVFPSADVNLFDGSSKLPGQPDGVFTRYLLKRERKDIKIKVTNLGWKYGFPEWSLWIPEDTMKGVNDVLLRIDYSGDSAEAYLNRGWFRKEQNTLSDNFYNGLPWEIGLKRFAPQILGNKLEIRIVPLYEHAAIYLEKWPEFKNGLAAEIKNVEAVPEYKATITESPK
jgi:hypothetical protein